MMNTWSQLFSVDWDILTTATHLWLLGGNPYGPLSPGVDLPGAFAYPPTALTWLTLFEPFGTVGFFLWTALQLGGWWFLIRNHFRSQLILLCWLPLVFHLLLGQTTLAIVLVLWAATMATKRGFWWGMAVAFALTKPQAALLPVLWLLWHDRRLSYHYLFWLGILSGTIALALPPTFHNPGIWIDWFQSLTDYRSRTMQMVPWQGFGLPVLFVAFLLWYHRNRGRQARAGWQWWLSAAIFPQTALYSTVVLLPLLRPKMNYWTIVGLGIASLLIGPATEITLPIILSGHLLAAWFICGGPQTKNLAETS